MLLSLQVVILASSLFLASSAPEASGAFLAHSFVTKFSTVRIMRMNSCLTAPVSFSVWLPKLSQSLMFVFKKMLNIAMIMLSNTVMLQS